MGERPESLDDAAEETLVLVAPLENLRSDIESLEIGRGLRITRLMGIDFRHLSDTYAHVPEYQDLVGTSGACTHCFQMDLYGSRDDLRVDTRPRRTLVTGLSALRLVKPGRVGIHFTWTRGPDGSAGWLRNPIIRPFYTVGPTYDLYLEEADALQSAFSLLSERAHANTYKLALRRFETTYEKHDPEDRLVDCWIALEALFGGGQSEISYRICLRIAVLLAEEGHREALFSEMRKSYDVRSRIVHGSRPKQDLQALLETTEDIVRTALRRALQSDWPTSYTDMDTLVLAALETRSGLSTL